MFPYIDNYILVTSEHQAVNIFEYLSALLEELGLPLNPDKRTPPTKIMTCLGIRIDTISNTLRIDQEQLKAIHSECIAIRHKKFLTKKQYQFLLGKLIYLHKCVKPSRIFVNIILQLFRDNHDTAHIHLTDEFHRDLEWLLIFLPQFNGTTFLNKPEIPENTLY